MKANTGELMTTGEIQQENKKIKESKWTKIFVRLGAVVFGVFSLGAIWYSVNQLGHSGNSISTICFWFIITMLIVSKVYYNISRSFSND